MDWTLVKWVIVWILNTSHMSKVCHQPMTLLGHWEMVEPLRGVTKWQKVWFLGPQSFPLSAS